MSMPVDVLIAVEDPGAANFVADLPGELTARGLTCRLFVGGAAAVYLAARGVEGERISPELLTGFLRCAPHALVVGTSENPDALSLPLISAAVSGGIPTVAVVDGPANLDRRFRGRTDNPFAYRPDLLAVPDQSCAAILATLGFDPARILVTGHPHYDYVREEAKALEQERRQSLRHRLVPGWREGQVVVTFLSELNAGLEPGQCLRNADYTLLGDGAETRRTEIVFQELLRGLAPYRENIHLVLRLHPKQSLADLAPLGDAADHVSIGGAALPIIVASDLVVGMTSMALGEAMLAGRPALSIVPRRSELTWLPAPFAARIRCAATRDEVATACADLLSGRLPAPPPDSLVPRGALARIGDVLVQMVAYRRDSVIFPVSADRPLPFFPSGMG